MKIVALYKTFSGKEWVEASVESIYDYVDKIVMVHSKVSWTGKDGNTVEPVVEAMPDPDNKIINLSTRAIDQTAQYQVGIDYIDANLEYDIVQLIDTDEVWDAHELEKAIKFMEQHPERSAYMVGMYIYIKTPFYRIVPAEGRPTCFIREAKLAVMGARGVGVPDKCMIYGVRMHHFTAVRKRISDISEKIMSSFVGDSMDGGIPEPDVDTWLKEKWNLLPNVEDFHYFPHIANIWHTIEKIWIDDVPEAIKNKPIMDTFLPDGFCRPDEERALYDIAKGLYHCIELGTYHGRMSVILSLAAREVFTVDLFEKLLEEPNQQDAVEWKNGLTVFDVGRKLGWYNNIGVFQSRTAECAGRTQLTDLLFIDASHAYKSVKADFEAWYPFVIQGGLIVFHDYDDNSKHCDIKKFVNEMDKEYPLMIRLPEKEVGSLAIFAKCD